MYICFNSLNEVVVVVVVVVMYNMTVELVPVVLGCTGVVSKECHTYLRRIPGFTKRLFTTLQKAVILGSVHVFQAINI